MAGCGYGWREGAPRVDQLVSHLSDVTRPRFDDEDGYEGDRSSADYADAEPMPEEDIDLPCATLRRQHNADNTTQTTQA